MAAFRYQNLSLASQELYVSRQALSKSIREMEQELGFELFTRTKYGIKPTDEGLRVAQHVSSILDHYEQMFHVAPTEERAEIHIFTFDDIIDYLSADFVVQFVKAHPNILLHLVEQTDTFAHDSLLLRKCDGAIVPDSIDVTKFENEFLFHSQYGCIIHKDNPLSQKDKVTLSDLQKQRVIGKNRELLYYQNDLKFIQSQGCKVTFVAEVSDNFQARELVRQNIGVAFAWDYSIQDYLDSDQMVFRPLIKEGWGRDIFFIQSTDTVNDKNINTFKKFLLDWVRSHRKTQPPTRGI